MTAVGVSSGIFRDIFSTEPMRRIFADENRIQKYLDIEAALARAQARLGIIPQDACDEICRHCVGRRNTISASSRRRPSGSATRCCRWCSSSSRLCRDGLGEWCHWGATTQDITDTATILQIREALDLVEADIVGIADALAGLAKRYRDTPMAGRSNLQQAVPITFGYKMRDLARGVRAPPPAPRGTATARPGRRVRRRRRHAVLARHARARRAGRADEGTRPRPAGNRLAHRARPHCRGRLLPRPRHRRVRQDRVRREADDADRGRGGL